MNTLLRLGVWLALSTAIFFAIGWWVSYRHVADAEDRYQMANRANDLRAKCDTARYVVDAQFQAKRADQWQAWKQVAARDCALFP